MATQYSFETLRRFLPERSYELVMPLIQQHKVHLTITRERSTKLGDYRQAWQGANHRISINGNLNRYAFLITLLHELAHLLAHVQFGYRIAPHGREWKGVYSALLGDFLKHEIFPADVAYELQQTRANPGASTCVEEKLTRVLRRYNSPGSSGTTVEEIQPGTVFALKDGRKFVRGPVLRKRIQCTEEGTRKQYLFHPLYEVLKAS